MMKIEDLLQTPCWIIDILPMQVPEKSPGQYFAIEDYFLKEQMAVIRQKHANVILKLNCYRDIELDGEKNPKPRHTAATQAQHHDSSRMKKTVFAVNTRSSVI